MTKLFEDEQIKQQGDGWFREFQTSWVMQFNQRQALSTSFCSSERFIFSYMDTVFEWDKVKAEQNVKRRGISFEEATTVFADPLSLTIPDPLHSAEENRFVITGLSHEQRQLVVVFTERGENIRIISVRLATSGERMKYEEGTG